MDIDAELMLRFKQGDVSSFEKLMRKYKEQVVNIIYRFIGDRDEAEDLAIEVFLKVYKSAKAYRAEAKFSTYLYRITVNLCINELKRRKRHKSVSLNNPVVSKELSSPVSILEQREREALVKKMIDTLPPTQRIPLILQVYEGLSYKEISKVLGCSVKGVERRLYRAKTALRKKLEPYLRSQK